MNLREIREKFVELSGRVDLVEDLIAYADQGADYYINAGIRELDTEAFQTWHSIAVHYEELASGEYFVALPDMRSIAEVWVSVDSAYYPLGYLEYKYARKRYGASKLSTITTGTPRTFTPVRTRPSPDFLQKDSAVQDSIRDKTEVFESPYKGIVVLPAASMPIVVEVHGSSYSAKLDNNDDENFWSVNFPDILVKAAIREVERSYRNRQGAEDISRFITEQLTKLDMDSALNASLTTDQMGG